MKSEFRKLINKEFGDEFYQKNAGFIKKDTTVAMLNGSVVYQEFYKQLKDQEVIALNRRRQQIHDVMIAVLQMSRGYALTLFTYLFSSMVLLILELEVLVTLVAILILTVLFVYKTHQFLVNKFCYIDAQLVLVYKMVVEQILVCRVQQQGEDLQ